MWIYWSYERPYFKLSGQAILTEDIGEFVGIDDCKCGRKGKYFKFKDRVDKSETRGCGDTFAEKRDKKW